MKGGGAPSFGKRMIHFRCPCPLWLPPFAPFPCDFRGLPVRWAVALWAVSSVAASFVACLFVAPPVQQAASSVGCLFWGLSRFRLSVRCTASLERCLFGGLLCSVGCSVWWAASPVSCLFAGLPLRSAASPVGCLFGSLPLQWPASSMACLFVGLPLRWAVQTVQRRIARPSGKPAWAFLATALMGAAKTPFCPPVSRTTLVAPVR